MSVSSKLTALVFTLLLAACGSTPQSDYYILSTMPGGSAGNTGPFVGVGPITVPQYLDRKGMVTRSDRNHLKISTFQRWAEPLPDGVQRVMAVNLATLLDTQQVTTFPWLRSAAPDYGVELNVVELSAEGNSARLIVKWVLRDVVADQVLEQQISSLTREMDDTQPASIAAAYSELLGDLSQKIANRITEAEAGRSTAAES